MKNSNNVLEKAKNYGKQILVLASVVGMLVGCTKNSVSNAINETPIESTTPETINLNGINILSQNVSYNDDGSFNLEITIDKSIANIPKDWSLTMTSNSNKLKYVGNETSYDYLQKLVKENPSLASSISNIEGNYDFTTFNAYMKNLDDVSAKLTEYEALDDSQLTFDMYNNSWNIVYFSPSMSGSAYDSISKERQELFVRIENIIIRHYTYNLKTDLPEIEKTLTTYENTPATELSENEYIHLYSSYNYDLHMLNYLQNSETEIDEELLINGLNTISKLEAYLLSDAINGCEIQVDYLNSFIDFLISEYPDDIERINNWFNSEKEDLTNSIFYQNLTPEEQAAINTELTAIYEKIPTTSNANIKSISRSISKSVSIKTPNISETQKQEIILKYREFKNSK